jgi:cytochrome c peroxidase
MKHRNIVITAFIAVMLGAGSIALGERVSVKRGKALFNDPELGSTGSSCNTCHPDGMGLEKAANKKNGLSEEECIRPWKMQ